ncbi:MAG: DUF885 family protein, partial [Sciscionella sp.]
MSSTALAMLCRDYFAGRMAADPFAATVYGIPGYDAEVPDPSRQADSMRRAELDAAATQLAAIARDPLPAADKVTLDVLRRAITDELGQLAHPLREVSVSATIAGDLSEVLAVVPSVTLTNARRAEDYLRRLGGLGGYFDATLERHRQAAADGRWPTARGVSAAVAQLDGLLATDIDADPFLRPELPSDVDGPEWRRRAAELLREVVRPALSRTRAALAEEFASVGRDDTRVGVCHLPGGAEGYAAAVAAHTTTSLSAEEIHQLGLDMVTTLRAEFAELGARALGTSDVDEVIARLRDDPALRFVDSVEIVDTVTEALHRATNALPGWFRVDDLARVAPCEVREMDVLEAEGGVLGYYLPPAADGSRAGLHAINTLHPGLRPRFEYE